MKLNTAYILIVMMSLLIERVNAQNETKLTISSVYNLKIGDKLPDFEFKRINDKRQTARTRDFNNRLLLIDFWSINCPGCIEALPRMDSLQKQFGNKVMILPVTYEEKKQVLAFWNSNKYTKDLSLPSVIEDKLFSSYFKHKTIPHEVWIYKGEVIAITGPDYVDSININKIISGEKVNWPVKYDFYAFDGIKEPIFKPDTNQVSPQSVIKYSAISDYKDRVNAEGFSGGGGIVRDSIKRTIRAFFLNQPIFTSFALNNISIKKRKLIKPTGQSTIGVNEVVWEVADKNKYKYISKAKSGYEQEYVRKNAICFESLTPDTGQTNEQIYKNINDDLNRLLGLNVRWERRKEKVFVLKMKDQFFRFSSKTNIKNTISDRKNGINPHVIDKGNIHQFSDVSLNFIIDKLNSVESNPYFFDETGYKGHIDIKLSFLSWSDINSIRKGLALYGLDLNEEEREVDKFIFSEIEGGLLVDGEMIEKARVQQKSQENMKNPQPSENSSFLEANRKAHGVITLPSGLQYKIIKQGTGTVPTINDKVSVHYSGSLINGKIFDSSYKLGRPFLTKITDVIEGWKEALQLMPVGSKWVLYIPSRLAYGSRPNQDGIPPNSTLVFEVELLQIIRK